MHYTFMNIQIMIEHGVYKTQSALTELEIKRENAPEKMNEETQKHKEVCV